MLRFDVCYEALLDREGRSDDEADGDPDTSFGVTQPIYDRWCAIRGLPGGDVDDADPADLKALTFEMFWVANKCHELPLPLDAIVFDVAFNSTPQAAARLLQEAVGGVVIDGKIGSKTITAAHGADPLVIAARMLKGRINQYVVIAMTNPKKYRFLRGWLRRVGKLLLSL